MDASPGTYDPLAALIEEHWAFRSRTRRFVDLVRAPRPERGPSPLPPREVASFASFLGEDVELRHGSKEEQGLFPVLARHLPEDGGPLGPFLEEHGELRAHRLSLAKVGAQLANDEEDPRALASLLQEAETVRSTLEDHMEKEDTMLFPMAREVLTLEEVREVSEVCLRLEKDLGPVHPEVARTVGGPSLTPFCPAGRSHKEVAERG